MCPLEAAPRSNSSPASNCPAWRPCPKNDTLHRMKNFRFASGALLCMLVPLQAQIFSFTKDQMVKYTAKNPFERFDDGRPKVPDSILEKCKGLSAEEVWAVLGNQRSGFPNQ